MGPQPHVRRDVVAVPARPDLAHELAAAARGDHAAAALLEEGELEVHADHRVDEEVARAAHVLPEHLEAFGAFGLLKEGAADDGFVEGARGFGERHREFGLDHRQISHLPVVEGVAKLMALLQDRGDGAEIGREDARDPEFIESRVEGAPHLPVGGLRVDPPILEHQVDEGSHIGIHATE